MSAGFTIRTATADDFEIARVWLMRAGLPTEDLTSDHLQEFLVAMDNDGPVGMVGLELCGDVGLLRSLIVDTCVRSRGAGRALVAALEGKVRHAGVQELWLLTIDADAYFEKLGYEVRDRAHAPDSIRSTREFSELCPDDAVLMHKEL